MMMMMIYRELGWGAGTDDYKVSSWRTSYAPNTVLRSLHASISVSAYNNLAMWVLSLQYRSGN